MSEMSLIVISTESLGQLFVMVPLGGLCLTFAEMAENLIVDIFKGAHLQK